MINRISLKNFKCLLDIKGLPLGPFTILIGPNDSGKSSLFEAMTVLGKTATGQWSQAFAAGGGIGNYVWRKEGNRSIRWEVEGEIPQGKFRYTLELSPSHSNFPIDECLELNGQQIMVLEKDQQRWQYRLSGEHLQGKFQMNAGHTALYYAQSNQSQTLFRSIAATLSSSEKYSLRPDELRKGATPVPNPRLSPSGENVVALLDFIMTHPDRSLRNDLETILHGEVPTVAGIALNATAPHGGGKLLEFGLPGKKPVVTIPASLASDGLLLLTAFLALSRSESADLVFIEEPENGLHFSRLKLVIDVLRKMANGEFTGRPRQVIISTHSPLLLALARPDEVRIFRRGPDHGTTILSMTEVPKIDELLNEFNLGELWFLLGEEGLVKGEQP